MQAIVAKPPEYGPITTKRNWSDYDVGGGVFADLFPDAMD
jgi:hypothetical protein